MPSVSIIKNGLRRKENIGMIYYIYIYYRLLLDIYIIVMNRVGDHSSMNDHEQNKITHP